MWKFMAFGIIVQTIIFMSLMDVYIFEKETRYCHIVEGCPRKIILFVIDGLRVSDLNETLWKDERLKNDIKEHNIHEVIDTEASMRIRINRSNETIFDDQQLLYLGPELYSEYLTDEAKNWESEYIDEIPLNYSSGFSTTNLFPNYSTPNTSTQLDNFTSYLPHHALPELFKADTAAYRTILMRFPITDELKYSNDSDRRIEILKTYLEDVYSIVHSPEIWDENNVYVISSSMETFTFNSSHTEQRNNSALVVWSKKCPLPVVNFTLDYFNAFEWLSYLVSRTDPTYHIHEEKLGNIIPSFSVEGNILDFLGLGKPITGKNPDTEENFPFNSLELLNFMLFSMRFMDIDYDHAVLIGIMLLIIPWVLLLSIKAWKLVMPVVAINDETIDDTPYHFLGTTCFAMLGIVWIFGYYWGWKLRHFVYHFMGVILFGMCGDELMSLSLPSDTSVANKLKILFQFALLFATVEGIFWATTCGRSLFILFITIVAAKIFQGAFSTNNFKIIISLAVSSLFVGVIFLCPIQNLMHIITLNITICLWMVAGFFSIKFLISDSVHDRFIMFMCLIELVMASIFANIFFFSNNTTLILTLSFFLCLGTLIPLLGGSDVKSRVLALSVTTASFFLFFSFHGEGLLLFAFFMSCFCSFLMDKETSNKQPEGMTFFCIFPVLFYTVTIIAACEMIMPIANVTLFQSYVLTELGIKYDFMTYGLVYFIKLGFLFTLLGGTAITSNKKSMELPFFFLIIVILNLVSFRTFLHVLIIPQRLYRITKTRLFIKHILMQTFATVFFYLYPFIQIMLKSSFFMICQGMRNIGLDPIKQ